MTLRYLLDTSTLSAVMVPAQQRAVVQHLEQRAPQCAIAAIVWHELSYGCARLPAGKKKAKLKAFLQEVVLPSFPILAYDQAAAFWHAEERARQERTGRPGPFVDGQIAAIARVNDLIVVTANVKDFSKFAELTVQDWTRARAK